MGKEIIRRRNVRVRRVLPPAPEESFDNGVDASSEEENDAGEGGGTLPEAAAADYIAALRSTGERGGVAAFPAPATRPARAGVVVPPDYVLPEGFARHFQSTDAGRQLEPILVVSPGYEIVDESGDVVALADDRIVPPEYAPPDLPLRMLELPSESPTGVD